MSHSACIHAAIGRNTFPKHLMLGQIGANPGCKPSDYRQGYLTPPVYDQRDLREEVISLHKRMALMMEQFDWNIILASPANQPITITPSCEKKTQLSKRSIPYYYSPAGKFKEQWSFDLYKKCRSGEILSYHKSKSVGKPHLIHPLKFNLDEYPFFRIEGHLGREYHDVLEEIEGQIRNYNLPIDVIGLQLHQPAPDAELDRRCFADIQALYLSQRNKLVACLIRLIRASKSINQQLAKSSQKGQLSRIIQLNEMSELYLDSLQKILPKEVWNFRFDSFISFYAPVVRMAKASNFIFKLLEDSMQTPLTTIYDAMALIDSCADKMFESISRSFQIRKNQVKEKTQFQKFYQAVPGLEHQAGVRKGGTFVIVYDEVEIDRALPPDRPQPVRIDEKPCFESKEDKNLQRFIMKSSWPDIAAIVLGSQVKNTDGGAIISGQITDQVGNPLPGASIIIKGTTQGTITNFNGEYELSVSIPTTIIASMAGYQPEERELPEAARQDFKLSPVENLELKVTGTVYSKRNALPIPGAKVAYENEEHVAFTNDLGQYEIERSQGDFVLVYSFNQCESERKEIPGGKDSIEIDVELDCLQEPPDDGIKRLRVVGDFELPFRYCHCRDLTPGAFDLQAPPDDKFDFTNFWQTIALGRQLTIIDKKFHDDE